MVQNLLKFFGREWGSVHQAAFLLAFAGILAKLLALYRDRLLAIEFGASRPLDLYYVAFRVPDFIYTFSLFFAASTALIPILLEKFSDDEKKAEDFFGNIFSLFGLVVIFLVALAYSLMPFLAPYIAPGFSVGEQEQVILLSRILLLSPLFLGLSNLVSSVIQSFKRFFIYALSPLLYNLGIIAGIIFLQPRFGLRGVVWGVVLGAILHLLIQLPTVFSLGFSLRPRLPRFSPDVIRSLKLSAPRTLGLSVNQLMLTVITALGSTLGAGAVAIFNFASNLQSVPLLVFGLSYSLAAFPTLASSYARDKKEEFLQHFSLSLRHIIFWSVPATVLFIMLRAQIVRVILGAGAFGWVDTRLTAAALLLLSLAILAQGLIFLFLRAFYAAGRTMLPVLVNVVSAAVTIFGAFWFLNLFRTSEVFHDWFLSALRVKDISEASILILPLAVSLGAFINIILLLFYFRKIFGSIDGGKLSRSFRDSALGGLAMGVTIYYALQGLAVIFDLDTFLGIFSQGFLSGVLGLFAGGIVLYFLRNKEFREISGALHRHLWRQVPVVASEPEELP
jgi:putative peptidoglycan lipid II flippase